MSQSWDREHLARVTELTASLKKILVQVDALDLPPDVGAHLNSVIVRLEQIADCGSNLA